MTEISDNSNNNSNSNSNINDDFLQKLKNTEASTNYLKLNKKKQENYLKKHQMMLNVENG